MVNTDSCIEHLVQSDGLALKLARGTEDVQDLQEKGLSLLKPLVQKNKDQLWYMWAKMAKSANTKSTDHSVKDTTFAALFPYYIDALIDESTESRVALVGKATKLNQLVSKSIESNRDNPFPIEIVSWIKNSDETSEKWVGFMYIPFYKFFENLPKSKIDKLSGYSTRTGKVQREIRSELGYTAFLQEIMVNDLQSYTPKETPYKVPTNYNTDVFRIWRVHNNNPKLFPYLLKSIQPQAYRVVFWTVVLHIQKEMLNSNLKTILYKIQTTMAQLLKSQDVPEIKTTTPTGDTALPRYPNYRGDLLRTTKLKEVISNQYVSSGQTTQYHLIGQYSKKLVELKELSAALYKQNEDFNAARKKSSTGDAKEKKLETPINNLVKFLGDWNDAAFWKQIETSDHTTKHILVWGRFARDSLRIEQMLTEIQTELADTHAGLDPGKSLECPQLKMLTDAFDKLQVEINTKLGI